MNQFQNYNQNNQFTQVMIPAVRKTVVNPVYVEFNDLEAMRQAQYEKAMAKMREERRKKAEYYAEQIVLGVILLAVGVIVIALGYIFGVKLLGIVGVACSLFGLYCMISKQMILHNEYYFEVQDKINLL